MIITKQKFKYVLKKPEFELFLNTYRILCLAYNKFYDLVLGKHPNNTIFSFNFHNVKHINEFLHKAAESLENKKHIVADIGAGSSPYYNIFASKSEQYIAVDLPQSLPKNDNRPIKQVTGLAENIPLEDAISEIVLCNQALEHVRDSAQSVSEIYRILKPGGKFIGSVPHISPVHLEPYDFRRYTDLGVKQLLENAGFVDITIEGNGGVYSTVALILAMDWMLSARQENQSQKLFTFRALLLAPLVGLLNTVAIILDRIFGDKQRTPANLCWTATKPDRV